MSAPTIRVTPEILYSSSGDISSLGGQISSSVSELSSTVDGIRGAYEGQLEAAVGARVSAAQGAANNTTNRIGEASADLTRRASVFEAADNASMEQLASGSGALKDWTGTNMMFTQYGQLQKSPVPIVTNYLNLGNLSSANHMPSAQLNPMVVPNNGLQSTQQGAFSLFNTGAQFLQGPLNTAKPLIGISAIWLRKSGMSEGVLTGGSGLIDFIAEGKYNVEGVQRVIGGEIVKAGVTKITGSIIPGVGWIEVADIGVEGWKLQERSQLTIEDKAFGLDQKLGLLDPSEAKLLHQDVERSQKSLDKIDLGKVIDDVGELVLDPVATPIRGAIDVWKNPNVENITRLGHMIAGPQMDAAQSTLEAWRNPTPQSILNAQGHLVNAVINPPLSSQAMSQDPTLQSNVLKNLGTIGTDSKSLVTGVIEYPFDKMKLGVDAASISISKVQHAMNGITDALHQTLD